jgi:hypothetical protein
MIKGYLGISLYFPCAIVPSTAFYRLQRPEGAIQRAVLSVVFPLDRAPWEDAADAGSKTWLVAQAMDDDSNALSSSPSARGGAAALYRTLAKDSIRSKENANSDNGDSFHIRNYASKGDKRLETQLDSDDEVRLMLS